MVPAESTVLTAVPLWDPIVLGELCVAEDVSLRLLSLILLPFLPSHHLDITFAVLAF